MYIGKWKITCKDFVWFIICLTIVLCFCVGIIINSNTCAAEVLSGSSTAVSTVLSIVAILYTMIEGANSAKINQDSENKLKSIDNKLEQVTHDLTELYRIERKVKKIIPKICSTARSIEQISNDEDEPLIEDVKDDLEFLLRYVKEDIDD